MITHWYSGLTFCQHYWTKEINFHNSTVNLYICFHSIATGTDASIVNKDINVSIDTMSTLSLGWDGLAVLKVQLNHFGWKPSHFISWLYVHKVLPVYCDLLPVKYPSLAGPHVHHIDIHNRKFCTICCVGWEGALRVMQAITLELFYNYSWTNYDTW